MKSFTFFILFLTCFSFRAVQAQEQASNAPKKENTQVKVQEEYLLPQMAVFEKPVTQAATLMTLLGAIVTATGTTQWLTYNYYLSDPDIHRDLKDEALKNPWANPTLIIGGSLLAISGTAILIWQLCKPLNTDEEANAEKETNHTSTKVGQS